MGTMMPFRLLEFPSEAFLHVLYRLPLKYLMRLRCVSKFFLALTNNQKFIFDYRCHCKPTNPPPDLVLLNDDFSYMDTTTTTSLALVSSSSSSSNQWQLPWRFHITFKGSNFIYLQKRHELIPFHCPNNKRLIGSINGSVCFGGGPCSLEIYNISAGTHFNLSYPHPRRVPPISGFGYDPISNDYNILCLDSELYSFRTNSWKQLDPIRTNLFKKLDRFSYVDTTSHIEGGGSVCINGIIYWPPGNRQVYDHPLDEDNNNNKMIVLFDLHKEKFSQIPLPEEEEDEDLLLPIMTNIQLLYFRGCLAFAFINRRRRRGTSTTKTKSRKGGRGGGGEIWVELFKWKRRSNAEENNYSWIRESFVVPIPSTRQKEAEIVSCCGEVFLGWFESKQQLRLYNLDTKEFFDLPLSPPSHHYPKVSWGKNDTTYIDNLRFNFSLI